MFHLVNKYGNVHKKVESERKRDELIAAGYRLVEEPVEVASVEEPVVDGVAPYEGPQQADEPQQVDDPLQMHTTEDDTQAVKDPEPEPEDKEPKPAKSPKTTGGKTTKGATKSNKTKKNAAEERSYDRV